MRWKVDKREYSETEAEGRLYEYLDVLLFAEGANTGIVRIGIDIWRILIDRLEYDWSDYA